MKQKKVTRITARSAIECANVKQPDNFDSYTDVECQGVPLASVRCWAAPHPAACGLFASFLSALHASPPP